MERRVIRWFAAVGLIGGPLFVISGRWADPWLWAYVTTCAIVALYVMIRLDDDLARERFHPPDPGADRLSLRVVRLTALAHLIV
jgi:hypothetical protein